MKKIIVNKTDEFLGYIMYMPDTDIKECALLVYLHGAGERGTVLEHIERHGVPQYIKDGGIVNAIVLCPQCPADCVWNNIVEKVKKLIDKIVAEYKIKNDRICITGSSMGGYGAWEMGMTYSEFFSAVVPVCGGGMQWRAGKLKNTPVCAYHGDLDDVVEIINSEMMVKNINNNGGNASLVVLKGFGHNDGIYEAYNNTNLINWIVEQRRTNFEKVQEIFEDFF